MNKEKTNPARIAAGNRPKDTDLNARAEHQRRANLKPLRIALEPFRVDVYVHDADAHSRNEARQVAAIHALTLKLRSTTRRLKAAVARITNTSFDEGELLMSTNPPANLDDAIAELTATEADENTAASAIVAFVATVPAQIQAAVDAATKLGATPAQLSAIAAVGTSMATAAAAMKTALAAPVTT